MKNTKKGFIVPLLIAIIAVLAIGGGVYIYSQIKQSSGIFVPLPKNPQLASTTQNTPTNQAVVKTNTTPSNQASDLKTYTNTQYGFEFNYPKDWVIDDSGTGPTVSLWSSENKKQEAVNAVLPIYPEFSVNYKTLSSFNAFAKDLLGKDINGAKDFVSSNFYRFATTEIGGKTAYAGFTVANRTVYSLYVEYNNGVYVLSTGNLDDSSQDPSSPKLNKDIQEIISTFKFTK